MRQLFTSAEARAAGITPAALQWGARHGRWQRITRTVYAQGPEPLTALDIAVGVTRAAGGVASGRLAGVLWGLDGVVLAGPEFTVAPGASGRRSGAHRRKLAAGRVVVIEGIACTDGLQTLVDLAASVDALVWEQALESALRKGLTTIGALDAAVAGATEARAAGVGKMRRVVALRPVGAPPTESLLETLMVQLARGASGVPDPIRQHRVFDQHGRLVARLDLSWPWLGLFCELDGQQHLGQPLYDASRETAVVAATGWLCARFTWREVKYNPAATARRLSQIVAQAHRRPLNARAHTGVQ